MELFHPGDFLWALVIPFFKIEQPLFGLSLFLLFLSFVLSTTNESVDTTNLSQAFLRFADVRLDLRLESALLHLLILQFHLYLFELEFTGISLPGEVDISSHLPTLAVDLRSEIELFWCWPITTMLDGVGL